MTFAVTLLETFAIALAAVLSVALLSPFRAPKPNWRFIFAYPIGITIAKAIQLQWAISDITFCLALVALVGLFVLVAVFRKRRQDRGLTSKPN